MKIISIKPVPFGAGEKTRALFDVELDSGIKLYNLKLTRGSNGLRVYGPRDHNGATITFPIEVANHLATLAQQAMGAVANVRY